MSRIETAKVIASITITPAAPIAAIRMPAIGGPTSHAID